MPEESSQPMKIPPKMSPCPFCGNTVPILHTSDHHVRLTWIVSCECGAALYGKDALSVRLAWNRRSEAWILRGLPPDNERVLMAVQYDNEYGQGRRVGIGSVERYDDGDIDIQVDDGIEEFSLHKKCKIYAWRPLPQPPENLFENEETNHG